MDLKKFKAMVKMPPNDHMQWVFEDAQNVYEARLAIEAKYGKCIQGPIEIQEDKSKNGGWYIDNWR